MTLRAQLGTFEPLTGKFITAIGHILTTEYTHGQHFPGRQLRLKFRIEVTPGQTHQVITVTLLHQVVDKHRPNHVKLTV